MLGALQKIIVVTGHYGSGKTNLSGNLALDLRRQGEEVTLADLDIVNPYFRSADFEELAAANGMRLITPQFANSNLDVPALTAGLDAGFGGEGRLIIDVGGDDAGAFALGRFAPRIREKGYSMLYVLNCFRYLTRAPQEAADLMRKIEGASRLRVTHLCNNSNLAGTTAREDVLRSLEFAGEVARLTGLPLLFTAVDRELARQLADLEGIYPVDIIVKLPWNETPGLKEEQLWRTE